MKAIAFTIVCIPVVMFLGGMIVAGAAIDAVETNYTILVPAVISTIVGGAITVWLSNAIYSDIY